MSSRYAVCSLNDVLNGRYLLQLFPLRLMRYSASVMGDEESECGEGSSSGGRSRNGSNGIVAPEPFTHPAYDGPAFGELCSEKEESGEMGYCFKLRLDENLFDVAKRAIVNGESVVDVYIAIYKPRKFSVQVMLRRIFEELVDTKVLAKKADNSASRMVRLFKPFKPALPASLEGINTVTFHFNFNGRHSISAMRDAGYTEGLGWISKFTSTHAPSTSGQ